MATHGCTGVPCSICGSNPYPASAAVAKTVDETPLACTQYVNAKPSKTFDEGPGKIISDAAKKAMALLPDMSLTVTRNAAYRSWVVSAACVHCNESTEVTDITDNVVEDCLPGVLPALIVEGARARKQSCIAGTCIDPMERMVDGLAVRECLERYSAWQREDVRQTEWAKTEPLKPKHLRAEYLTVAQVEAARTAWSAALKRKQAEQREKERNEVVCERDEDGE